MRYSSTAVEFPKNHYRNLLQSAIDRAILSYRDLPKCRARASALCSRRPAPSETPPRRLRCVYRSARAGYTRAPLHFRHGSAALPGERCQPPIGRWLLFCRLARCDLAARRVGTTQPPPSRRMSLKCWTSRAPSLALPCGGVPRPFAARRRPLPSQN